MGCIGPSFLLTLFHLENMYTCFAMRSGTGSSGKVDGATFDTNFLHRPISFGFHMLGLIFSLVQTHLTLSSDTKVTLSRKQVCQLNSMGES
jgi:hypothetical protein